MPLRHIILVALNTGMRKSEILNLEWGQVNLEEGFIRIEAQRSKNRKIRVIPLNNSMKEVFYKLHYRRNGNQHVFENPKTGKAFLCINRRWRTLLKDLGIKKSCIIMNRNHEPVPKFINLLYNIFMKR